jgi:hypothetical protein
VPDKVNRPTLELYLCLLHGIGFFFYVGQECTAGGSSMSADCVMRSLSKAWIFWQKRHPNLKFPEVLAVQGDNTVKEVKNGIFAKLLIMLTSADYFKQAAARHLKVGHTHEDGGKSKLTLLGFAVASHSLCERLDKTTGGSSGRRFCCCRS